MVRTFGLSHSRKTTFGVLGRGHLGVLGGGSRSLSCSGHSLDGDVAVVIRSRSIGSLVVLGPTLHFPHATGLSTTSTARASECFRRGSLALVTRRSARSAGHSQRCRCDATRWMRCAGSVGSAGGWERGRGEKPATAAASSGGSNSDDVPIAERTQMPGSGVGLSVPISKFSSAASEDATVQRAVVEV